MSISNCCLMRGPRIRVQMTVQIYRNWIIDAIPYPLLLFDHIVLLNLVEIRQAKLS